MPLTAEDESDFLHDRYYQWIDTDEEGREHDQPAGDLGPGGQGFRRSSGDRRRAAVDELSKLGRQRTRLRRRLRRGGARLPSALTALIRPSRRPAFPEVSPGEKQLWERLLSHRSSAPSSSVALLAALWGIPYTTTGWGHDPPPSGADAAAVRLRARGGHPAPGRIGRPPRHLLGRFFLLLATPFSNRPLLGLVASGPFGLDSLALVLSSLHFDAFLPYFFWKFVGEFPTPVLSFRGRRVLNAGTSVSLAAGLALSGIEIGRLLVNVARSMERPVASLIDVRPLKPTYGYYSVVLSLAVLALAFLVARIRTVAEPEARRVRVFVAGLAAMAPLLLYILLDAAAHKVWVQIAGHPLRGSTSSCSSSSARSRSRPATPSSSTTCSTSG